MQSILIGAIGVLVLSANPQLGVALLALAVVVFPIEKRMTAGARRHRVSVPLWANVWGFGVPILMGLYLAYRYYGLGGV